MFKCFYRARLASSVETFKQLKQLDPRAAKFYNELLYSQVFERVLKDAKSKSNIILRSSIADAEGFIKNLNPPQDISIVKKMENHLFPYSKWGSFYIYKK